MEPSFWKYLLRKSARLIKTLESGDGYESLSNTRTTFWALNVSFKFLVSILDSHFPSFCPSLPLKHDVRTPIFRPVQ